MSRVKPTVEHFDTISALQDRARELLADGFVVLQAVGQCGHWIGYSAFRPKQAEGTGRFLLLFTDRASSTEADPLAIYAKLN